VLVHGAFADSSSWAGVVERLQANGVQVLAEPTPGRDLASWTYRIDGLGGAPAGGASEWAHREAAAAEPRAERG